MWHKGKIILIFFGKEEKIDVMNIWFETFSSHRNSFSKTGKTILFLLEAIKLEPTVDIDVTTE